MVYFWGRENGTPQDVELLAQGCRTHLSDIPGVLRLEVSVPAGTDRPVVDNSYAVSLLVEFADAAAQDVYQEHPDHYRFIDACKQYWSRVQVYDSLVVTA